MKWPPPSGRLKEFTQNPTTTRLQVVDPGSTEARRRSATSELKRWASCELSHRFKGWELAEDREDIPYELVFVDTRPLTESEKEYGRVLANEELDGGR